MHTQSSTTTAIIPISPVIDVLPECPGCPAVAAPAIARPVYFERAGSPNIPTHIRRAHEYSRETLALMKQLWSEVKAENARVGHTLLIDGETPSIVIHRVDYSEYREHPNKPWRKYGLQKWERVRLYCKDVRTGAITMLELLPTDKLPRAPFRWELIEGGAS